MSKLKIVLICLIIGLLFVLFPRGSRTITVYNNGEGINEFLPWFSAQEELTLSGIPFETELNRSLDGEASQIKLNGLKVAGNFLVGNVAGGFSALILSRLKKSNN